jgi:hypothetical protein
MSMQKHGGMISTRGTPDSSTKAVRQSYQQTSSSKAGGNGAQNDEFCVTKYVFSTSKGSLTCLNILHGADGFASPPKEGVLGMFIALKNPSPSARFEAANLRSNGEHANH